jgi:hypothetical protein
MFEFEHTKTQQELKTTLKSFKYSKHFHSSDLFRVWYLGHRLDRGVQNGKITTKTSFVFVFVEPLGSALYYILLIIL